MTAVQAERTQAGTESDIGRWYCPDCFPAGDVAYCGTDVSNGEFVEDDAQIDCIVCRDLEYCPICDPAPTEGGDGDGSASGEGC